MAEETQTESPLSPTTTVQQDKTKAGQRHINLIWEITQAVISVMITAAVIYTSIFRIQSDVLSNAFFLVVSMYLVRTNHTKIGGINDDPHR